METLQDLPCGCEPTYYGPSVLDICTATSFFVFMSLVENVIRNTCTISDVCNRVNPTLVPDEVYDFIVIGGGSGGAVTAGRLSEVEGWKVLLIEAGIDEPPILQVPTYANAFGATNKDTDWQYKTEPEKQACLGKTEQRCSWPRGKMLGGCSSMNGMMHTRGTPTDYDGWAAAGNEGWSYEDVLPWFKFSEDNLEVGTIVDEKYHGTGGKVTVSRFNYQPEMVWDVLKAAEEVGLPVSDDIDGEKFVGVAIVQADVKDGTRLSSARAYLRPARDRPNLHVMLNSTATRILFDSNKTAIGVELMYKNETFTVKASKEVILAAGTINSPQLLLLSGVGSKEILDEVGIEQVHELPGVGKNLMNHVGFWIAFDLNNITNTNTLTLDSLLEYIENRDGPLSAPGVSQLTARLNSKYADPSGLDPDIQLFFGGSFLQTCSSNGTEGSFQDPDDPDAKRTFGVVPVNLHPKSRGYISIRSSDPFEAPIMVGNYLTEPEDIEVLVEAVRIIQKIGNSDYLISKYGITPEVASYGNCSEINEYDSDDFWKCCIRFSTYPENHQTSTCKMGPASDELAVVDNQLRVYGVNNLRITDASVMPKVVSGNTHPTIVMIAERAVNFIKTDWLLKKF